MVRAFLEFLKLKVDTSLIFGVKHRLARTRDLAFRHDSPPPPLITNQNQRCGHRDNVCISEPKSWFLQKIAAVLLRVVRGKCNSLRLYAKRTSNTVPLPRQRSANTFRPVLCGTENARLRDHIKRITRLVLIVPVRFDPPFAQRRLYDLRTPFRTFTDVSDFAAMRSDKTLPVPVSKGFHQLVAYRPRARVGEVLRGWR